MADRLAGDECMKGRSHAVKSFPTDPDVWTVECDKCGEIVATRNPPDAQITASVPFWTVMPEKGVVFVMTDCRETASPRLY